MKELNYITIGTKIKERRKAVGKTQETVANYLDVNPSHVCNIEVGRSSPSLTALVNIANVLECSVDYFIDGEYIHGEKTSEKDNIDRQIMRILRYCDYDTKHKIYEISKILTGYNIDEE